MSDIKSPYRFFGALAALLIWSANIQASCGDSDSLANWLQLFQSGSPDADINNDGRLSGADYNAYIHSDCELQSAATALIPVNFLSAGHEGPYSEILNVGNRCPEGSEPVEIIEKRSAPGFPYYDMPLITCMASADSSGGFAIPESPGQVLEFGGAYGQYKDYDTPIPNPLSGDPLWHDNPYTGTDSCDSSKGFQAFNIQGLNKVDWSINVCFAVRSENEPSLYPEKSFHGFVRQENACPLGEAKIIHGTVGSPHFNDGTNMDDPLYMCIKDRNDGGSGENLANVVGLKLLGLNSHVDDESGDELADLTTSSRISKDALADYIAFTIKAEVSYFDGTSSRVVQDDFPHNLSPGDSPQIPFRIRFNQTGAANRQAETTMNFAPYTINYTNENPDGSQTIYFFVATNKAVGNYSVTATPLAADSDQVVGNSITVHFEIYDPDDDGSGNSGDDDTRSPETPSNLRELSKTSSRITLAWDQSTDLPDGNIPASGVGSYTVYEANNRVPPRSSTQESISISGLQADTAYRFQVSATDLAGNESSRSETLEVTTEPDDGDNNTPNQVDGWTVFEPSSDSKLIYVSSIHPNRTNTNNDGSDPNRPLASLRRGYDLLRSGYPDWLLLHRGSVFSERLDGFRKGGRSPTEKMVIQAYGENADPSTNPLGNESGPRPIIRPEDGKSAISTIDNTQSSRRHLAFMHLHLKAAVYGGGYGVSWNTRHADDLLFEGLRIENFFIGVSVANDRTDQNSPTPASDLMDDVIFRRCVIANNGGSDRSQGLISKGANTILEENFFFRNGWRGNERAGIFAHNLYFQMNHGITSSAMYNNIVGRASNNCSQMRDGGIAEGNVFFDCPSALAMGNQDDKPAAVPVYIRVRNNSVLNPADIGPNNPQGFGIGTQNAIPHPDTGELSEVSDNIITNPARSSAQALGLTIGGGGGAPLNDGLLIRRNIIKDHRHSLSVSDRYNYIDNFLFEENTIFTDYLDANIYRIGDLNLPDFNLKFRNNRYWSVNDEVFDISDYNESQNPDLFLGTGGSGNPLYDRTLDFDQWMNLRDTQGNFDTGSVLLDERPRYVDDSRSLETYAQSIGLSGEEEMFSRMIKLRKGDWPSEYTADAINEYLREGFTPQ